MIRRGVFRNDGHQGHDSPGRFQEQGRGQEDRVFQETEPAFDFQTFLRQCGLIQFILTAWAAISPNHSVGP
jgi:hypothetical protein